MIFLDDEHHWIMARTREELIPILLSHLEQNSVDLQKLAAACFGCDDLDVVVLENWSE